MRVKYSFFAGLTLMGALLAPVAKSQTLWTNTPITFQQFNPNSDDVLTTQVSLTRLDSGPLFNDSANPDTVLWAEGSINNYLALNYQPMSSYQNGDLQAVLMSTSW